MVADSPDKAPRKPPGRSRVTNGKLGDMDGRGKWARRFADLIQLYSQDVGDDPSSLPQTVKSLIRRAATMTVELERSEASFAKAGKAAPTALADYQTTSNSLRRILQDLQVKAGLFGHLDRPMAPVDGSYIRGVRSTITIGGWELGFASAADKRDIARRIAFSINEATLKGLPLPSGLAAFAVENGLAEYDKDKTIEHTDI